MTQVGWQERAMRSRNELDLGGSLGTWATDLGWLRIYSVIPDPLFLSQDPSLIRKASWIPSKNTRDNPSPASSRLSSLERVT